MNNCEYKGDDGKRHTNNDMIATFKEATFKTMMLHKRQNKTISFKEESRAAAHH